MEFTFPNYYKEFSCIAGSCPDTCCAGWQIVIDNKTLKKYQHFKGPFHNRLHNDIDWKEHVFRQYNRRCAFLNEENLCDIYTEAGPKMLCDTCRNYPRHIEEFESCVRFLCPFPARKQQEFCCLRKKKFILLPSKRKPLKKPMMILITFYLLH